MPGHSLPKQHRALQAPPAASLHDPRLLPGTVAKHRLTSQSSESCLETGRSSPGLGGVGDRKAWLLVSHPTHPAQNQQCGLNRSQGGPELYQLSERAWRGRAGGGVQSQGLIAPGPMLPEWQDVPSAQELTCRLHVHT